MSDTPWGDICNRVDSCALSGAAAFFAGIPGAEILANGPLWCYFYALRRLEHTEYNMADRFHGSQPDNNAIVYGTESFLTETVQRLVDTGHKPSVLFVENSCSISLIGDDVNGILRKMDLDFPTVAMDCGGLTGGFAEGWRKACLTLLKKVGAERMEARPATVNLIGLTDYYFNGEADRKEIIRLLERSGYEVNVIPGCAATRLGEYRHIGAASLNLVFHEELGLDLAEELEKQFGTPYLRVGLPYGVEGTRAWLERIGERLTPPAPEALEEELKEMHRYLTAWNNDYAMAWGGVHFDNVLVAAPGTQALCFSEALRREWVDTEELTVICQNPVREQDYCTTADTVYTVGEDNRAIEEYMAGTDNVLVVGSSGESSNLWRRKDCRFISCNLAYPVKDEVLLTQVPFVGIRGAAHLQQRLWNAFMRYTMAEV